MARPQFNSNGNLIRYNNSPSVDQYGNTIQYQDDRSNPTIWNQETGLRINQTVVVTENAAQASTPTPVPAQFVNVTTVPYDDYNGAPPILAMAAGRSISALRSDPQVVNNLSVTSGMVAEVNGVLKDSSFVPPAGSLVRFREPNKRRG
jgi:hypothetical protein